MVAPGPDVAAEAQGRFVHPPLTATAADHGRDRFVWLNHGSEIYAKAVRMIRIDLDASARSRGSRVAVVAGSIAVSTASLIGDGAVRRQRSGRSKQERDDHLQRRCARGQRSDGRAGRGEPGLHGEQRCRHLAVGPLHAGKRASFRHLSRGRRNPAGHPLGGRHRHAGTIKGAVVASSSLRVVAHGGDGVDTLTGGDDGETLIGDAGDDTLVGGGGNDTLDDGSETESAGADRLDGGAGDDTLSGGPVRVPGETLIGGDGNDTADYSRRNAPLTIELDNVANDGEAGEADDVQADVEGVIGGSDADALTGNDAPNVLDGQGGDDRIPGYSTGTTPSMGATTRTP